MPEIELVVRLSAQDHEEGLVADEYMSVEEAQLFFTEGLTLVAKILAALPNDNGEPSANEFRS